MLFNHYAKLNNGVAWMHFTSHISYKSLVLAVNLFQTLFS
jgi:hypothetical protein